MSVGSNNPIGTGPKAPGVEPASVTLEKPLAKPAAKASPTPLSTFEKTSGSGVTKSPLRAAPAAQAPATAREALPAGLIRINLPQRAGADELELLRDAMASRYGLRGAGVPDELVELVLQLPQNARAEGERRSLVLPDKIEGLARRAFAGQHGGAAGTPLLERARFVVVAAADEGRRPLELWHDLLTREYGAKLSPEALQGLALAVSHVNGGSPGSRPGVALALPHVADLPNILEALTVELSRRTRVGDAASALAALAAAKDALPQLNDANHARLQAGGFHPSLLIDEAAIDAAPLSRGERKRGAKESAAQYVDRLFPHLSPEQRLATIAQVETAERSGAGPAIELYHQLVADARWLELVERLAAGGAGKAQARQELEALITEFIKPELDPSTEAGRKVLDLLIGQSVTSALAQEIVRKANNPTYALPASAPRELHALLSTLRGQGSESAAGAPVGGPDVAGLCKNPELQSGPGVRESCSALASAAQDPLKAAQALERLLHQLYVEGEPGKPRRRLQDDLRNLELFLDVVQTPSESVVVAATESAASNAEVVAEQRADRAEERREEQRQAQAENEARRQSQKLQQRGAEVQKGARKFVETVARESQRLEDVERRVDSDRKPRRS